jgi:hypothetical protein
MRRHCGKLSNYLRGPDVEPPMVGMRRVSDRLH